MNNMKALIMTIGMLVLAAPAQASERTIRATEMGPTVWSDLTTGKLGNVVIEFRQGDDLPITIEAQGDLIETRQAQVSYVGIKKNFWLRLRQNEVQVSFDGTTFKKFNDALTGSLEVGAGSTQNGGVADSMNIAFKILER